MYTVRLLKAATRDLEKLDRTVAQQILEWLTKNLHETKLYPLKGDLRGLYKLREGSYRIIFEILHEEHVILVHAIGHRRDVYKQREAPDNLRKPPRAALQLTSGGCPLWRAATKQMNANQLL